MAGVDSVGASRILYIHRFLARHLLALPTLCRYDIVYLQTPYGRSRLVRGIRKLSHIVDAILGTSISNGRTPIVNIRVVPPAEDIDTAQPLYLQAKRRATDALHDTRSTGVEESLASSFGTQGAASFFVKGTAYYAKFSQYVLDLSKLAAMYEQVDHTPRPHFPVDDAPVDECSPISIGAWTDGLYVTLVQRVAALRLLGEMVRRSLFGSGITLPSRRSFPIANEIGHPEYVDGGPGQADYLVDGETITAEDVLYYRTSRSIIGGVDPETMAEFASSHEPFVDLRSVSPSLVQIVRLIRMFWSAEATALSDILVLQKALTRKLEYEALYEEFDIRYDTTPTFSNDKRAARLDSGLVTEIANKHGTEKVSYQTRPYYIYAYEHEYDLFDRLYVWSEDWVKSSRPAAFDNVREVVPVGSVFGGGDRTAQSDKDIVAVFTTDLNLDDRHNLPYNREFVEIAIEVAEQNPGYEFVLKPKFESQTEDLLAVAPALPSNFRIKEGLYDTESLIKRSYVTIAIGMTSPGIDAFIRGKRAIYYSDIGELDGPLGDAEFVCNSRGCVHDLFERYDEGYQFPEAIRDRFDPYRDGRARDRILADLFDHPEMDGSLARK